MKSLSKTRLDKSYAHHHPDVWDKTAEATTCLIALQALVLKPESKVNEDQIEELVDAAAAKLLEIKDYIDRKLIQAQSQAQSK